MKKIRLRGFTLVELMVVIVIIAILAVLVTISVVGASKKSRDDKRIGDASTIAAALDQYATENLRKYPTPSNGATCSVVLGSSVTFCSVDLPNSGFSNAMSNYLNPVPPDPAAGKTGFGYVYVYRSDGLQAAVIVKKFEQNNSRCNAQTSTSLPDPVKAYGASNTCYYVAR